ncbi:MAG: hypothetical protein E7158_04050 [Firmicutes bacterium]|nr:hypothetical protein [Bacillota bacterium]
MKFNKKQKKIMRLGATVLFCIALVLLLDMILNKDDNNKFIGTWYMGYEIYDKETGELKNKIVEELVILKDGTFYTNEKMNGEKTNTSVSGSYKINNSEIVLKYNQLNKDKSNTLHIENSKLCMNSNCNKYYTKDKLEKYFGIRSSSNNEGE